MIFNNGIGLVCRSKFINFGSGYGIDNLGKSIYLLRWMNFINGVLNDFSFCICIWVVMN